MDYSKYPSEVLQKKWIRHYLEETALINGMSACLFACLPPHLCPSCFFSVCSAFFSVCSAFFPVLLFFCLFCFFSACSAFFPVCSAFFLFVLLSFCLFCFFFCLFCFFSVCSAFFLFVLLFFCLFCFFSVCSAFFFCLFCFFSCLFCFFPVCSAFFLFVHPFVCRPVCLFDCLCYYVSTIYPPLSGHRGTKQHPLFRKNFMKMLDPHNTVLFYIRRMYMNNHVYKHHVE